ncbi:uncharacterized protein [Clytia hemisphaerica]
MVGEKGKVVGIDPIKERIEKAKDAFSDTSNLEFHQAFGRDASNFGDDFDLVIMVFVLHWLTPAEKEATLKSIFKCLKRGGQLLLNPSNGSDFFKTVIRQLSVYEKITSNFYYIGVDEIKNLLITAGFGDLDISEEYRLVFQGIQSLDDFIHWIAASIHTVDYEPLVVEMLDVCQRQDMSFMYNESGQLTVKHPVYNIYCKK